MNKKNIIIFSDLDGTLLHDDYIFSPKTIEVVEKLYKKGIYLIPITARTIKDLKQKANLLGIDKFKGIIVASNGAQIYDYKTDKLIFDQTLPKEFIKEIFNRYHNKFFAKLIFYSPNCCYVFAEGRNSKYWAHQVMGLKCISVDSPDQIDEPITHFYIVTNSKATPEENLNEYKYLMNHYSDDYKVDSYNNRVFDISVKGVDKGCGVNKVMQYLNLDETTTHSYGFGDGPNDFSLLKACTTGVAMKNGIIELKEIADHITDYSNDKDGVARYICDKILNVD
ncbi:Cof-type HAD-IIB family hydrolase [Mycoplasma capricolum]|uniref:Cof-type HAD-IIB family hydrolase n=1 Tax=Mycoplasma capricolum TaxID=2095 RepID=UPI003DA23987